MSLTLFLRKRRVLLVIFLCSLSYFIIATYKQHKFRAAEEEDIVSPVKIEDILKTVKPVGGDGNPSLDVLIDQTISKGKSRRGIKAGVFGQTISRSNSSRTSLYKCRNSVQGRAYIADENGYICDRFDLQINGCCKADAPSSKRYKCDKCSPSGCCVLYEQCVSCCLHPQKVNCHDLLLR